MNKLLLTQLRYFRATFKGILHDRLLMRINDLVINKSGLLSESGESHGNNTSL